ncbi:unnamed protein product [Amoebophrya sp. A25]|nr:unnamed protein product [Amoebophrya sp. A25]|eukprot:GSA25T00010182001.1
MLQRADETTRPSAEDLWREMGLGPLTAVNGQYVATMIWNSPYFQRKNVQISPKEADDALSTVGSQVRSEGGHKIRGCKKNMTRLPGERYECNFETFKKMYDQSPRLQ